MAKKSKYSRATCLPKGVATINQFIGPSLESAFHSLTKCHPALNGQALVSIATNSAAMTNYLVCSCKVKLHTFPWKRCTFQPGTLLQKFTSNSKLSQKLTFQLWTLKPSELQPWNNETGHFTTLAGFTSGFGWRLYHASDVSSNRPVHVD